jgi:hypothetical protein
MCDFDKLRGRIVEKHGKHCAVAYLLGVSEHTLSVKLNGKIDFRQSEIAKLIEILSIPKHEIADYFFNKIV